MPKFDAGGARLIQNAKHVKASRTKCLHGEKPLVAVCMRGDSEHGLQTLNECSIVVAPYSVDGEGMGTIAVLGPTRMNYPQALAAVAVVGNRLGRRLSEG